MKRVDVVGQQATPVLLLFCVTRGDSITRTRVREFFSSYIMGRTSSREITQHVETLVRGFGGIDLIRKVTGRPRTLVTYIHGDTKTV